MFSSKWSILAQRSERENSKSLGYLFGAANYYRDNRTRLGTSRVESNPWKVQLRSEQKSFIYFTVANILNSIRFENFSTICYIGKNSVAWYIQLKLSSTITLFNPLENCPLWSMSCSLYLCTFICRVNHFGKFLN